MQEIDTTAKAGNTDPSAVDGLPAQFRLGDLLVDTMAQSVRRGEDSVALPHLSWLLLIALARRWPAVASQEELMAELWPDVFVGEEALTQRVKLLRRSLEDDRRNPRYIKTVRGTGYRLATAVETIEQPAEQQAESARPWRSRRRWWMPAAAALAFLVVAFGLSKVSDRDREPAADGIGASIAVLPFADLSPAGEPEHFGAALHEEIIQRLSGIAALRVVPRTSVLRAQTGADGIRSIREVAERLRVDAVVEGSVRRVSNRIRVTMKLLDGKDESQLWSNSYEREFSMESPLEIQSEIAERIAEALRVELSASERESIARLPTASLAAYNLYLLGRYHTYRATPEDLVKAIEFLGRAVEEDPQFADAWASLGAAHSFMGTNYGRVLPKEAYGKARAAVLRALALDSSLVQAHAVHADVLTWYDWDWQAAEREYRATMTLNPDYLLGYALFLSTQKRHEEAIELSERALARYPDDSWVHINAAWNFLRARLYDRAIRQAELAGDHRDVNALLGWSHLARGEHDTAVEFFQRDIERNGRQPNTLSNLASGQAAAGRVSEARELLDELLALSEHRFFSPGLIAPVYIHLGELDQGFSWLERALELRTRDLIFLAVDHSYDSVRTDPRYLRIIDVMNLPASDS